MNTKFWDTKRVTVTGGAGFLGTYIIKKLKERGCRDIFVPLIEDYDLVDMSAIKRLYDDAKPDIVIHLAAIVGGIGANCMNPGKYFYDNLMMGVQMMEIARQQAIEKFVAIGTICAYPKFTPVPFCEKDLWNGYPEETNAPYGLAKKMLLVQAQAYRKQYGFNAIYLLPVNLYGPGDNFDPETSHVIAALIRKVNAAKQSGVDHIEAWGTGVATRGFLYVEDAAEGIILAAEKLNKSEPVNLGSTIEISIKELAEKICTLMDFEGEIRWDTSKPDGQPRRSLDVSRAKTEFGFEAQMVLDDGLKRTIEWYTQNQTI